MKSHQPRSDEELERSIRKQGNMKMVGKATNGGLEKLRNNPGETCTDQKRQQEQKRMGFGHHE